MQKLLNDKITMIQIYITISILSSLIFSTVLSSKEHLSNEHFYAIIVGSMIWPVTLPIFIGSWVGRFIRGLTKKDSYTKL